MRTRKPVPSRSVRTKRPQGGQTKPVRATSAAGAQASRNAALLGEGPTESSRERCGTLRIEARLGPLPVAGMVITTPPLFIDSVVSGIADTAQRP